MDGNNNNNPNQAPRNNDDDDNELEGISSRTVNLHTVFTRFYTIPDTYQRRYEWNENTVRTLLVDIMNGFLNDTVYPLGNIILTSYSANRSNSRIPFPVFYEHRGISRESVFMVTDGQQRLTTLSLLFSALRYICQLRKTTSDKDEQEKRKYFELLTNLLIVQVAGDDVSRLMYNNMTSTQGVRVYPLYGPFIQRSIDPDLVNNSDVMDNPFKKNYLLMVKYLRECNCSSFQLLHLDNHNTTSTDASTNTNSNVIIAGSSSPQNKKGLRNSIVDELTDMRVGFRDIETNPFTWMKFMHFVDYLRRKVGFVQVTSDSDRASIHLFYVANRVGVPISLAHRIYLELYDELDIRLGHALGDQNHNLPDNVRWRLVRDTVLESFKLAEQTLSQSELDFYIRLSVNLFLQNLDSFTDLSVIAAVKNCMHFRSLANGQNLVDVNLIHFGYFLSTCLDLAVVMNRFYRGAVPSSNNSLQIALWNLLHLNSCASNIDESNSVRITLKCMIPVIFAIFLGKQELYAKSIQGGSTAPTTGTNKFSIAQLVRSGGNVYPGSLKLMEINDSNNIRDDLKALEIIFVYYMLSGHATPTVMKRVTKEIVNAIFYKVVTGGKGNGKNIKDLEYFRTSVRELPRLLHGQIYHSDVSLQAIVGRHLLMRLEIFTGRAGAHALFERRIRIFGIDGWTIEHLFPQSNRGSKNLCEPTTSDMEEYEFLNRYLNHLGNLLVVPHKLNNGASNKTFRDKMEYYSEQQCEYGQVRYVKSLLRNPEVMKDTGVLYKNGHYTKIIFDLRQKDGVQYLCKEFGLDFVDFFSSIAPMLNVNTDASSVSDISNDSSNSEECSIGEETSIDNCNNNADPNVIMEQHGYTVREIPGDGNCLFRAVALQVYGSEDEYDRVRQEVATHMEKNAERYNFGDIADFPQYIQRMRTDSEWGGHHEIQAIRERYDRPVHVYNDRNDFINILDVDTDDTPILLYFVNQNHYNAIICIADNAEITSPPLVGKKASTLVCKSKTSRNTTPFLIGDYRMYLQEIIGFVSSPASTSSNVSEDTKLTENFVNIWNMLSITTSISRASLGVVRDVVEGLQEYFNGINPSMYSKLAEVLNEVKTNRNPTQYKKNIFLKAIHGIPVETRNQAFAFTYLRSSQGFLDLLTSNSLLNVQLTITVDTATKTITIIHIQFDNV